MSLGASWAGVDVRVAVEVSGAAANTHSRNHSNCTLLRSDIQNLDGLPLARGRNEKIVLFGGPPCQGFSTSNQRTRGPKNEKNLLYREFLRITRIVKPDFVVFENVCGMLEGKSRPVIDDILDSLNTLGFECSMGVLDAIHFGVPQSRKRLFIVGGRGRIKPNFPKAIDQKLETTVKEAIGDLPKLGNGASQSRMPYRSPAHSTYAKKMRGRLQSSENNLVSNNAPYILDRYKHIPPGGNWEDIPARLMRNYADRSRCHTGVYHRLRDDEPSIVIGNFRKNMLIHPTEHRGISVREAARLQSFPDNYIFEGSVGLQQQQVGNAVPPLLAKAVFEGVVSAF